MANWKKVLVSGSSIEVASITASVVPLNDNTSFRTLMIDPATGHIFRTGSYGGGGGGGGGSLEALTDGAGIIDFSYNGGTPQTVTVEGAATLVTNHLTRWSGTAFVTSSLSQPLTGPNTSITASGIISASGFKGNLLGTATNAEKIKVVDDTSTDSTFYVPFNDATTGFANQKIASSKFIFNPSTGKLTTDAIKTGNIVASGDITASGNISASGAVTASGFKGSGRGLTQLTSSKLENSLTQGTGVTSFTFNGSSAATVSVAGASALGDGSLVKWNDSAGTFVDSKIIEGTNLITIGSGTDDVKIPGDLTVEGTASFQNSTTLLVEDRYILINSGSTSGNQGGIVIQTQNTQNVGQLFGYNNSTSRWAIKSAFDAETTADFNPQAYMGLTSGSAIANPNAAGASGVNETIIKQSGNVYVNNSTQDIWIYS